MPKVSVLVPVYNVEKYIERCLVSIQKQTLFDIEIIVVNDNTPDNSMAIVKELAKEDKRIRILNHKQNMGLMWTRRTGYLAATANYITFCDSDDYIPTTALEKLYSAVRESNADIVSGNIIYIEEDGKKTLWKNELNYGNSTAGILKSLLRHELGHNLCGKLFRTSLLQKYEYRTYENLTNGEDACLFYQVVDNIERIVLKDEVVYCYIQNYRSSSLKRLTGNALESICITNTERISSVSKYVELQKDLNACVSKVLIDLFFQGYNKNNYLSELISKYNLDCYCSNNTIIKSCPMAVSIKLLIKKYLYHLKIR